ncbi:MAG: bifunctional phosphoglucose/phosphomannose isomerase [Crocinitomicaceae bacterium]|nr:bifunctional phosphoglucose/phosphomannose isomerase [Crocinitomicaceae bacterium]
MDKLIAAFIANIDEALLIAKNSIFQTPKNKIENIVICGMGGSGIGGKLVSLWLQDEINLPVQCVHDYVAPNYIGSNTLVIASSYSGNTEETLLFTEEAIARGAYVIGVCSGGQLAQLCKKHHFDCVIVPGGNPPRTALAFSIVQLSNIFHQLGYTSENVLKNLKSAGELLANRTEYIKSEGKKLAEFINGTVPAFYATTPYEAVLIRAKQQFNENSKLLCWMHVIPEMNHNELVGWGGGDSRFSAVYFDTGDVYPRNKKREEITLEVIASKTKLLVVKAEGNNFVERSIFLIHIVDWASFYLSEIKQVDAFEINIIDRLKSELANF